MMSKIVSIDKLLLDYGVYITDIEQDPESSAYQGYNFKLKNLKIKFRKAKLTPQKYGSFVAMWKRNEYGKTIPFHMEDQFDYFIIAVEKGENTGIFLFPAAVLVTNKIISDSTTEGKRGFRLYAPWDDAINKQAQKTKQWQSAYFIALTDESDREKNPLFNSLPQ
ncbi:MepB family protein [Gynurincola endophyticus]|uniref:MepB family protein n=1 Tax=Gynurincola endophyticus TaxID=2479004 RepID=UPI000F8E6A2F|nr:MepB family protein [Gynurincola endophyticus]